MRQFAQTSGREPAMRSRFLHPLLALLASAGAALAQPATLPDTLPAEQLPQIAPVRVESAPTTNGNCYRVSCRANGWTEAGDGATVAPYFPPRGVTSGGHSGNYCTLADPPVHPGACCDEPAWFVFGRVEY